jgi:ATP-binding cassette, subfamily A (ABC1), member 2
VTYLDVTYNSAVRQGASEPFDNYILSTFSQQERFRRAALTTSVETDPVVQLSTNMPAGGIRAKGWYDNRHHHALPTITGMINSALMRETMNSSYTITTINHPLPRTIDSKISSYLRSGTDLTVAINVIIALSFVPASFVLYLVNERMSKSKHLQFVSGVTPPVYWLSTFSW